MLQETNSFLIKVYYNDSKVQDLNVKGHRIKDRLYKDLKQLEHVLKIKMYNICIYHDNKKRIKRNCYKLFHELDKTKFKKSV